MDISILNLYDLIIFIVVMLIGFNLVRTNIKAKNYIIVFVSIFLLMTSYGIYEKYNNINKIRDSINNQSYSIVDGEIDNLVIMPKGGHALESFTVNDILFKISYTGNYPESKTLYYTLTKNRNGPIHRNGQKVKIYYIPVNRDNKIIKMWVY